MSVCDLFVMCYGSRKGISPFRLPMCPYLYKSKKYYICFCNKMENHVRTEKGKQAD